MQKKSVVVIGGGTGIFPVLQGLKDYRDTVDITAIVTMADSGGSTGRLRDEFGQLPIGDLRMALIALASEKDEHDQLLRELFLHRFDKGEGLNGHNFGNLLIVALTDMLGSESDAVEAASRILRVHGTVLPVTEDDVHIIAEYDDGLVIKGEHDIDEPNENRYGHRIAHLYTDPKGTVTKKADEAIRNADLIVLGPGDLYSSLLANCVIDGVPEAIRASKGQFVYASNLMTRPGQTDNMTACDHVGEVSKYVGQDPDVVIVNTGEVPVHLLERYAQSQQFPVLDDCAGGPYTIIREDLLSSEEVKKKESDALVRSLVRGDGDKFAKILMSLLE